MSIELAIGGIGWWSPGVDAWPRARALITGDQPWPEPAGRPVPTVIPANERRRAPETVLLAAAAAEQAIADAGVDASELATVFASNFGDLGINDYLCATLASTPDELSPTRFHNSVHNAASGYWSIATGAQRPTTALSAHPWTFATGLLEAASQVVDTGEPVLLIAYDIASRGPLADIVDCRDPFAVALLLQPAANPAHTTFLRIELVSGQASESAPATVPELTRLAAANPIAAGALPLLRVLAGGDQRSCSLPAGDALQLAVEVRQP